MNQVISASQFMIIKATIHDVPDLNVLVNSAYRGESSKQGWTTEADLLGGIRVDDHRLIEMITTTDSQILKYLDEKNKILACVHLEKHGGKLYLGLLTVSPVLQGKGIGKELLSEADRVAKGLGCHSIYMTVINERTELIDWYVRNGYHITGERKPFPADDPRFGLPKKQLEFIVLEKKIGEET